ncbi:hypothetical protein GEMRC1_006264 [Eukaryota sp. GEM-RC1]
MGNSQSTYEDGERRVTIRPGFFQRLVLNSIRDQVDHNDESFNRIIAQRPRRYRQPTRTALPIDLDVVLDKTATELLPTDNHNRFRIQVKFKANQPGTLRMFFDVYVDSSNYLALTSSASCQPPTQSFAVSSDFQYLSSDHSCLFAPLVKASSGDEERHFPLALMFSTADQTLYFFYVVRSNSLSLVKCNLIYQDKVYNLQELYGFKDSETDDGLCAICLYEHRNTTLLPCRHSSVCMDCATQLRRTSNKCPICRVYIEGLVKIDGTPL